MFSVFFVLVFVFRFVLLRCVLFGASFKQMFCFTFFAGLCVCYVLFLICYVRLRFVVFRYEVSFVCLISYFAFCCVLFCYLMFCVLFPRFL